MSKIETIPATKRKSWGSDIQIVGPPKGPWRLSLWEYKYEVDETGDWVDGETLNDGLGRKQKYSTEISLEDLMSDVGYELSNGKTVTMVDVMEFLKFKSDEMFNDPTPEVPEVI